MLRDLVVRGVKPVLSDEAWQKVRRLDPSSKKRDRDRAQRQSLTTLAQEFGTDKWGRHRYTPHYEKHLAHLRRKTFALLEIGIGGYAHEGQGGASLRMWKAYFPDAQVVGLDIEDKSFVAEERIRIYQGSQTDKDVLAKIMSENDVRVIIDDGSHQNAHVRQTFKFLFRLLPKGGVYVIEDTQTSYWKGFGGSTDPSAPTMMNLVKDLVDGLNYEEYTPKGYQPSYTERWVRGVHVYHNLVFIEKGANTEADGERFWSAEQAAKARAAASRTSV